MASRVFTNMKFCRNVDGQNKPYNPQRDTYLSDRDAKNYGCCSAVDGGTTFQCQTNAST